MTFLEREIERGRCREIILYVHDAHGQPLAGSSVSLYQTSPDFLVGASWSPQEQISDVSRYVERVAMWGSHLLVPDSVPSELDAACRTRGVILMPVTDVRGVSLARPPQKRWHIGVLRRFLLETAERLGRFAVYDVCAPLAGREVAPRSFALGGSERVQSDYLVELVTVCFSVPQVTGFFYGSLTDLPDESPPSGLLNARLSPRRAFKVVCKLFQNEWRTRVNSVTDARGQLVWRGFHGTYQWTVRTPDGTLRQGRFTLSADATPFQIQL